MKKNKLNKYNRKKGTYGNGDGEPGITQRGKMRDLNNLKIEEGGKESIEERITQ